MSSSMAIDLTILVPVYNEGEYVAKFFSQLSETLAAESISARILFINDGSTDNTEETLRTCGADYLKFDQNMGYGAALKLGIRNSDTDYIAIIDCDGTYDPKDLALLYKNKGKYDMLVGKRPREASLNNLAKYLLRKFSGYAAGTEIPDLNSGLRIFKRQLAQELIHILPNGFSLTSTITLGALSLPAMVGYTPISYGERVGKSKIMPFKHFWSFTMLILRTLILFNPLKFFLPPSLLFALVGLLFLARDLLAGNLAQGTLLMMVNAFILMAIGLLAEAIRTRK